jgi:hypothetical protein
VHLYGYPTPGEGFFHQLVVVCAQLPSASYAPYSNVSTRDTFSHVLHFSL